MGPDVGFRLLGPFELVVDGRDATPARPKQRALLAALLLRANEVASTDELLEALWGDRAPETAATALHGHVSALRKLLGQEAIETRPPGYLLRVAPEQSDLGRFQALLDEGRAETDPSRRAELLRSALLLFRGEPLSDFRYDAFARAETQRIEELRLAALEERIDAELALGRHAALVPELEGLVGSNPLRERLRGQLMLALYRSGRQAEALHAYQEGRRILAGELGLDPGPALQELERKILVHDASLAPPSVQSAARAAGVRRERKLVTVLFCDLVGFTARSEELDPEDVQPLLQPYFARVRDELERFGGTVEKFIGDAVMAVFGAPVAHEDDAERAVRAALVIRDALRDELELRIAVHSGEALVTLDADPRAGEGIAAGDVVNTAFRLQGFAPANGVIVGEQTYRASGDVIEYRELEPVVARGKRKPLRVWEALAPRAGGEPRRPGAALVGRVRELAQLTDLLARPGAERAPQLVTVVGVPGIGKTRLIRELYARVEAGPEDVVWLQGRSLPYGDGVSFWALGEIVKTRAGIYESDRPEAADEKLRLAVGESIGAAEGQWVLRHLRPLVGLAGGGELGGDRRAESFGAWRAFFEALAAEAALVLVFEDLHWADDDLLDFVDDLVDRAAGVAMVVVCTCRPELLERRPGWGGGKRNATTISLAPLSEEETAQLLRALIAGEPRPELVAHADGNPLYAEEYARLALEGAPESPLPVPQSLQSLIAARLDVLTSEEKALVQDAAVVGETAWAGAIAAVGERPRPAVEELARPLERKEFLRRRRRTSIEGETEYAFPHVLVRDVAYAQIPRAERSRKHLRTADWIESLGRREDHAELLAHHCLRALELARAAGEGVGELEDRAQRALADAGARAAALGAHHAAARYFAAALELVPAGHPARGELLLQEGRSLVYGVIAGEDVLAAAAEELTASGDRLGAATAEALLGMLAQEEGRGSFALARLAKALELVERLPPSREKGEVLAEACRSHMISGRDEETLRTGDSALAIAGELGLDELRCHVLISMAPSQYRLGDAAAAIDGMHQAIELASAINSPEVIRAYGNLRSMLAEMGDLPASSAALAEGQRFAERFGLGWYHRWLRFEELDELYFVRGQWDELVRRADGLAGERSFLVVPMLLLRARISLARDERSGAIDDAERALELARESTDPQVLIPALAVAGLVDLCAGRHAEAEACVEELAPLVRRFGTPSAQHMLPPLCVTLHRLGRSDDFLHLAAEARPNSWWEAGTAYASGEFARAADVYERIGSRPDEAHARLRAAETLAAAGRLGDAHSQAEQALSFFRSVTATAYIRDAEALLTASA